MPLRQVGLKINQTKGKSNGLDKCDGRVCAVSCRVGLSRSSVMGAITGRRMGGNDETANSGVASGYFRKTFFVGCTLTTPSIESIVNLLWYFSGVHLKRYKGQYTMNDTGPGKWQYSDRLAGNQLGRLLAACEQREVAYERQWVRISLWACSVCIIYVCMYLFIH